MKKINKITAVLCVFALLCGCSNSAGSSVPSSTTTSSNPTTSSTSTTSSTALTSSVFVTSNTSETQGTDVGGGMTLFGAQLDNAELEDFSLARFTEDYMFGEAEKEFLNTFDNAEIKDLYMNAQTLCYLLCYIKPPLKVYDNGRKRARIEIDGNTYEESGYTYESFKDAYLNVFTAETTEKIFQNHGFLNYNGALFYMDGAKGGNAWEVHREYELVSKSDSVIEFKRVMFSHDIDFKPSQEYDPALRDEYTAETVDFKLVMTDNGWRAEKFLNVTDPYEFLIA